MARKLILPLLLLSLAATALADQKILIPVYYNGPGAGTTWRTGLIVDNRATKPFSSSRLPFLIVCPIPEGCISDFIPEGQLGTAYLTSSNAGILLTAPDDQADHLFFRLLISAAPRNPLQRGTELPIVRERDFRTELISLPLVDLNAPVRVRLRVYDPDQHANAQVRVSLRDFYLGAFTPPRASVVLDLRPGSAAVTTPTYGELDVQAAFAAELPNASTFNIDVEPLTPGLRFWAFITITDNATNEVQTVTPH